MDGLKQARRCTGALLLAGAILTTPAPQAAQADDVVVGASIGFSREEHWRREMHEDGGVKPESDRYRMSGRRRFLAGELWINDTYAVNARLGFANLETHSSEGETTDFDSDLCIGVGGSWILPWTWQENIRTRLDAGYLFMTFDDETTTASARDETRTAGDLEIEWRELGLSATVVVEREPCTFLFGAHYLDASGSQNRDLGHRTVSSDFTSDDVLGLHVGASCKVGKYLSAHFLLSFLDETCATIRIACDL